MERSRCIGALSGAIMVFLAACGGCASLAGQPLPATLASNDADAQMEFWHTLPQR